MSEAFVSMEQSIGQFSFAIIFLSLCIILFAIVGQSLFSGVKRGPGNVLAKFSKTFSNVLTLWQASRLTRTLMTLLMLFCCCSRLQRERGLFALGSIILCYCHILAVGSWFKKIAAYSPHTALSRVAKTTIAGLRLHGCMSLCHVSRLNSFLTILQLFWCILSDDPLCFLELVYGMSCIVRICLVFTLVGVSSSLWRDCAAQTVVLEQLYVQKAMASIPIK